MIYIRKRGWEIPEGRASPEALFINRRALLAGLAVGGLLAPGALRAAPTPNALAGFYPAKRNDKYTLDRPLTPEALTANYNNFYEFGMSKDVHAAAQALKIEPWTIQIDGLVEKPRTIAFDDLVKAMTLEERLYRHRCVETWSMTIPWTGFPLRKLVALAKPLSGATYVKFQTFENPGVAPGQNQIWLPWPYVEGLTMAEAQNDLAFMVTGAYGKPLDKVYGAPLRLHTPWKYGFKSIKSIVKVTFVDQRPKGFWQALQGNEYGFWANVNPAVPHPRWSQATELPLGSTERRPTLIYNGYGEYVADIYKNIKGQNLFM